MKFPIPLFQKNNGPLIKCFSQFGLSIALNSEQKQAISTLGFWKRSTSAVANWLWEKPDILDVGSYEKIYDLETFECCPLSSSKYCF